MKNNTKKSKLSKNRELIIYTVIIIIITAIVIFIPYQYYTTIQVLRIIFGTIFILFLPGYFLTLSFFNKKEIDLLERFALSFALSISVIPLISFYLNLVWVKINELSIFLICTVIIALNIIYISYFKGKANEKKGPLTN